MCFDTWLCCDVQGTGIEPVVKYLLRRGLPRKRVHLLLSTFPLDYGLRLHYHPQHVADEDL